MFDKNGIYKKVFISVTRDVNEATIPRGRGHNPRDQDPSRDSYYYYLLINIVLINN